MQAPSATFPSIIDPSAMCYDAANHRVITPTLVAHGIDFYDQKTMEKKNKAPISVGFETPLIRSISAHPLTGDFAFLTDKGISIMGNDLGLPKVKFSEPNFNTPIPLWAVNFYESCFGPDGKFYVANARTSKVNIFDSSYRFMGDEIALDPNEESLYMMSVKHLKHGPSRDTIATALNSSVVLFSAKDRKMICKYKLGFQSRKMIEGPDGMLYISWCKDGFQGSPCSIAKLNPLNGELSDCKLDLRHPYALCFVDKTLLVADYAKPLKAFVI